MGEEILEEVPREISGWQDEIFSIKKKELNVKWLSLLAVMRSFFTHLCYRFLQNEVGPAGDVSPGHRGTWAVVSFFPPAKGWAALLASQRCVSAWFSKPAPDSRA